MKPVLSLEIELKNELMTTVRLTTGGIASFAGLSYDDGEDCKVCVSESLILLSHGGYTHARVAFFLDGGLFVTAEGDNASGEKNGDGDEISVALLNALAQDVVLEKKEGTTNKVAFRFGLQK